MKRWNLVIDVALCENCNNCVLANKDEYVGNEFPGYSAPHALHGPGTVRLHRQVRGEGHLVDVAYLPTLCNHCDNAPCMAVGGDAVRKRDDGIVIIDPVRSKGRRDIVQSCPYDAIVWNEALSIPQHWNFDAHLLDQGWQDPRCAQSCPTQAIRAVKIHDADMAVLAREQALQTLEPVLGTQPRVYYKNLHRYTHCFIGGSVLGWVDGERTCLEGALVTLHQGEVQCQSTRTDAFGDFKFDTLAPDSGAYRIHVQHNAFGPATVVTTLGRSQILGDIELPASASVV